MTLRSIYEDQEVLRKVSFYKQLKPILQTAVPRPVAPNYIDISTAVLFYVRQALAGLMSVQQAVEELATRLKQLTSNNQAT